jgi:hypothetical protein
MSDGTSSRPVTSRIYHGEKGSVSLSNGLYSEKIAQKHPIHIKGEDEDCILDEKDEEEDEKQYCDTSESADNYSRKNPK